MYSSEVISELKNDIGSYVITDIREVIGSILVSECAIFLDTGVVSRIGRKNWESEGHACIDSICGSINPLKCVFVITELILYELKDSQNYVIQKHNRDLITNMHESGYKVHILCEETIAETLNTYMSTSMGAFNDRFVKRITDNSPFLRTVVSLFLENPKWFRFLENDNKVPAKNDFISESILWLKNKKKNGDSLAEQILAMCILMLLDLPGRTQYIFCTNDKHARANLLKIIKASNPGEKDRVSAVMLEDLL